MGDAGRDLVREVSRKVKAVSNSQPATELLDDGECDVDVRVEYGGLVVSGARVEFDKINSVSIADTQVAFWLSLPHDLLLKMASKETASRLASQIRSRPIREISPGKSADQELVLRTTGSKRDVHWQPAVIDQGSPLTKSSSSSSSSGMHLVSKSLQREYRPTRAINRSASPDGQPRWCPFHPAHPLETKVPLDSVVLSGRMTLANTDKRLLQQTTPVALQRLHSAAVHDIAHSLGVPPEWVTVTIPVS
ncbi:hypothetical protein DIPPA_18507 [Diplonema papillatum]|nr:hypothetical protein DIPPA_18507 [Diplonema papillatum]